MSGWEFLGWLGAIIALAVVVLVLFGPTVRLLETGFERRCLKRYSGGVVLTGLGLFAFVAILAGMAG